MTMEKIDRLRIYLNDNYTEQWITQDALNVSDGNDFMYTINFENGKIKNIICVDVMLKNMRRLEISSYIASLDDRKEHIETLKSIIKEYLEDKYDLTANPPVTPLDYANQSVLDMLDITIDTSTN